MNNADTADTFLTEQTLQRWALAISHIANHYRIACSPGTIQANAPWFHDKSLLPALTQLSRQGDCRFACWKPTRKPLTAGVFRLSPR